MLYQRKLTAEKAEIIFLECFHTQIIRGFALLSNRFISVSKIRKGASVRPKKVCVAPFRYSFIITRHMQTMMILQQVKVS